MMSAILRSVVPSSLHCLLTTQGAEKEKDDDDDEDDDDDGEEEDGIKRRNRQVDVFFGVKEEVQRRATSRGTELDTTVEEDGQWREEGEEEEELWDKGEDKQRRKEYLEEKDATEYMEKETEAGMGTSGQTKSASGEAKNGEALNYGLLWEEEMGDVEGEKKDVWSEKVEGQIHEERTGKKEAKDGDLSQVTRIDLTIRRATVLGVDGAVLLNSSSTQLWQSPSGSFSKRQGVGHSHSSRKMERFRARRKSWTSMRHCYAEIERRRTKNKVVFVETSRVTTV